MLKISGRVCRRRAVSKRLVFFDLHDVSGHDGITEILFKVGHTFSENQVKQARDSIRVGCWIQVEGTMDTKHCFLVSSYEMLSAPTMPALPGPTRGSSTVTHDVEQHSHADGICKFWVNTGKCHKGASCRFLHPGELQRAQILQTWLQQRQGERGQRSLSSGFMHSGGEAAKSQRAQVFCWWLVATFGRDGLNAGTGVLDVAGGRGAVTFWLQEVHGVRCTLIEPRGFKLSKPQIRWLQKKAATSAPNKPNTGTSHPQSSSGQVEPLPSGSAEEEAALLMRHDAAPFTRPNSVVQAKQGLTRNEHDTSPTDKAHVVCLQIQQGTSTRTKGDDVATGKQQLASLEWQQDTSTTPINEDLSTKVGEDPSTRGKKCTSIASKEYSMMRTKESAFMSTKEDPLAESMENTQAFTKQDVSTMTTEDSSIQRSSRKNASMFSSPAASVPSCTDQEASTYSKAPDVFPALRVQPRGLWSCPQLHQEFGPQLWESEELGKQLKSCSVVVGMHPDQATEPILDFALRYNKPFVIVPCCVFPKLFPNRQVSAEEPTPHSQGSNSRPDLQGGQPCSKIFVDSYPLLVRYLKEKGGGEQAKLDFAGANIVVYRK